jgi:hypothetical protein
LEGKEGCERLYKQDGKQKSCLLQPEIVKCATMRLILRGFCCMILSTVYVTPTAGGGELGHDAQRAEYPKKERTGEAAGEGSFAHDGGCTRAERCGHHVCEAVTSMNSAADRE